MTEAQAPQIFDRALLRRRQARAQARHDQAFLLERCVEDLGERLATVKRRFGAILDLGTPRPRLAPLLAALYPEAWFVRAAPLLEPSGPAVQFVGDEEALPVRAGSFDLVLSLLALQAVNDLPGTLVQIRRALRPDGLFLGCLFGGQTLVELRQALAVAESEATGGLSPRVAPFSDLRDLGHLLQRAGFALPVTDVDTVTVRYRALPSLFEDLRAMGATNALALRQRRPLRRSLLLRAMQIYAERFAEPDGRLRATFEIVWLSGWAPDESQQKPLRPGSARMGLGDGIRAAVETARPADGGGTGEGDT